MDIFISYRRSDSQYQTWQLHRALCDVFGEDNVFLDVRDIDKGDDSRDVQFDAIRQAKVILVVIGDRWLTVTDHQGGRRLDDSQDNVRREIETAIHHSLTIIPVFLESVTELRREDLPDSIQTLARKNGHRLRAASDYPRDLEQLIDIVKSHVVAQSAHLGWDLNIKNDLKNVITDHGVSSQLLIGKPPPFFNCVKVSRTCYVPVSQKGHALVSGFTYNHFFGPSAVVSIRWPGAAKAIRLYYPRAGKLGEPANIFRKGSSILFHASYELNLTRVAAPMDDWLAIAVRNPHVTPDQFLRLPGGTLSRVLHYKVVLPQLSAEAQPFGVITRDLRKAENRVFTQYVFQIDFRLDAAPTSDQLQDLLQSFLTQHENPVRSLPDEVTPDNFLTYGEDRKVMDYLALRGLLGAESSFFHETGRFTRGFTIV